MIIKSELRENARCPSPALYIFFTLVIKEKLTWAEPSEIIAF